MTRGKFVMFGSHAPYANLEIEESKKKPLRTTPRAFDDDRGTLFIRTFITTRGNLQQLMMSYFNVRQ